MKRIPLAAALAATLVAITAPPPAKAVPFPAVDALYPGVGLSMTGDEAATCTAGFIARNRRGAPVMFTAGHCDHGGPVEVNSTSGGVVEAGDFVVTEYGGSIGDQADIAVMRLTGAVTLNPKVGGDLPVTGWAPSVAKGMWLCLFGAVSKRSCGPVVDFTGSKVKFAAHIEPGDSGAPVYGVKDDATAFAVGIAIRSSDSEGYPVAELIGPWLSQWGLAID